MKIRQAVAITLIRGGKVCMSKRLKTDCLPGKWQCAGGRRDKGDKFLIETAARELAEETGMPILTRRLKLVSIIKDDPTCDRCYLYELNLTSKEEPKCMEPNKMSGWLWFAYEDALKMDLMPGLENYLKWKIRMK